MSSRVILAGDAPYDMVLYPQKSTPGQRNLQIDKPRQRMERLWGGIQLISDLLRVVQPQLEICCPSVKQHVMGSTTDSSARHLLQLSIYDSRLHSRSTSSVSYSVENITTLEREGGWHSPTDTNNTSGTTVLVLEDIEDGVIDNDDAIDFFLRAQPDFVVYHMTSPLGAGKLWDVARLGPVRRDTRKKDPTKLAVVISADDLRAEGVELSKGLSWERTCEDFVLNMNPNGKLATLATCAHLVVLFGCDGAIYRQGGGDHKQTLVFDPSRTEEDYIRGRWVPGITEAFIAGMTSHLAQQPHPGLDGSMIPGLQAARLLVAEGIHSQSTKACPIHPVQLVMEDIGPKGLLSITIPSEDIYGGTNPDWSILHSLPESDAFEIARDIVREGPSAGLRQVPLATFNNLFVYDRREMEDFRSIHKIIESYITKESTRPLNIALFGPGRCGKSSSAMEVAVTASRPHKIRRLHFNLGEFEQPNVLVNAFNSICNSTLEGYLTIACFEGFDNDLLDKPLGWLAHMSSCMSSGTFLDVGRSPKHIGRAIFFLESSHAATFDEFERRLQSLAISGKPTANYTKFIACIHGTVNIRGPGQCDAFDTVFPVRRAVILRNMLDELASCQTYGHHFPIEDNVLNGLLLVPLRNGVKSLRSFLKMCKFDERPTFDRMALPPPSQIRLHMDYDEFKECMDSRRCQVT
ncbi:uncharacterized protein EURHEDRAFT_339470 [Aspergillus ruber CBS 135680]|uniref:Uncharacterized protein n=1 Tax=Aspergillus ruber (strain CBS 135680) TaxID=1388766 RepID=A0A017SKE3_ASPRC|nr:uncharacterized protein EURHEDRAFT_339470 [Aspergillus ruber CBS 135680]EYE96795.1 hypothetical protein EURHEDRAFT_339470 [Aspergillus ruber CBS 135680]